MSINVRSIYALKRKQNKNACNCNLMIMTRHSNNKFDTNAVLASAVVQVLQ